MPKFEKQYVHFMWDDELEGKEGFFADDIVALCTRVTHNTRTWYGRAYLNTLNAYQFFYYDKASFRFFYHDPHYNLKVAHEQGKEIECKRKGEAWKDWYYTPAPGWLDDHEYRIMQEEEKLVTNRELARWLAQGKGELEYLTVHGTYIDCYNSINYAYDTDNWDVQDNIRVRKWEDTEWHSPTREYMGLNTQEV